MRSFALSIGACFGLLGVAAGAFGAHVLKTLLSPELLQVFEVAVRYQLYHALAIVAAGILARQHQHPAYDRAAWAFVLGIGLFSGSLYLMAFSGLRWLGALTPLGGIAFLLGWAWLAWGAWSTRPTEPNSVERP